MTTHFVGDTALLTGRSLRHITRSLDTIITTTIMPIAFLLLFVFVFGGAIDTGRLVRRLPAARHPGHHRGVGCLLHGLPALPRPAERDLRAVPLDADRPVLGAVGARADLAGRHRDVGRGRRARRPRHGLPLGGRCLAWLAVAGILALFTLALTWLAVIPGLTAKSVDGASAFSYPLILLPFISSAFVPTATMPGPVRPSPRTSRSPPSSTRSATCSPAAGRHRHLGRPRLVPRAPRRRLRRPGAPPPAPGPRDPPQDQGGRAPGPRRGHAAAHAPGGTRAGIRRGQWTHHRGGSSRPGRRTGGVHPTRPVPRTDRTTCRGGTRPATAIDQNVSFRALIGISSSSSSARSSRGSRPSVVR